MSSLNGSSIPIWSIIIALLGIVVLAQVSPVFAVTRNYPPYSNCNFFNGGTGSLGGCDPGVGNLRAYSKGTTGSSQVGVYMYSTTFSLSSGSTVTLTNVRSSDVNVKMVLNSGDTSNVASVVVYLADPACSVNARCAYNGIVSAIWSKVQTTVGTYTVSGPDTGPNKTYSISTTRSDYRVVGYIDAATVGTHSSYIDIRNAPRGAYAVSATETN